MPRVGILALQGGFSAHERALQRLGEKPKLVRLPRELEDLDGLILPGGESTTQIRFFDRYHFWTPLRKMFEKGCPFFGTCSGVILLAEKVLCPSQPSLGFLPVTVKRNAYGSQRESFEEPLEISLWGSPFPGVFIRAPQIVEWHQVEVLATLQGTPVLVQKNHCLGATFHPELTEDLRLHEYFLSLVEKYRQVRANA